MRRVDCRRREVNRSILTRLLVLPEEDREEVVRVHDDVDEGVEGGAEVGVAARGGVGDHPPDDGDGGVVVHVEHRHLCCQWKWLCGCFEDLSLVLIEQHDSSRKRGGGSLADAAREDGGEHVEGLR